MKRSSPRHAEVGSEVLLVFASVDTVVRARMATPRVLPGLMALLAAPDKFGSRVVLSRSRRSSSCAAARHRTWMSCNTPRPSRTW